MLKENSVILFQGDSITDAFRTDLENPSEYGLGYPYKIKQYLDIFAKDKNITVINRAVSGNRTSDLLARWDEDCIAIKPDYLSILIGVNDTWRRYDSNMLMTAQQYEDNYRELLTRATKAFDCQLIILEPFLIPSDPEKAFWYEDLMPKIYAARKIAREFGAIYIPLDGVFNSSCTSSGIKPEYFTEDGVHPNDAGHSLIAKLWLDIML